MIKGSVTMPQQTEIDWSVLPAPQDDGACEHLQDMLLPAMDLPLTSGGSVDLSGLSGTTVLYIYPLTAKPGGETPDGWDMIPGARGCTPQSCSFRDHFHELRQAGADHLYGLSSQDSAYQQEAAQRLHLPFALISDEHHQFTDALSLPTFEAGGKRLLKRTTLIIRSGRIVKVFYPVFPPDKNAGEVLAWLTTESRT